MYVLRTPYMCLFGCVVCIISLDYVFGMGHFGLFVSSFFTPFFFSLSFLVSFLLVISEAFGLDTHIHTSQEGTKDRDSIALTWELEE